MTYHQTPDFRPSNPAAAQETLRANARQKLMGPSIVLIVFASLGILGTALALIDLAQDVMYPTPPEDIPEVFEGLIEKGTPEEERFGNLFALACTCVMLLVDVMIVVGAIAMLRLRAYWLAVVSALLAIVSLFSPCCVLCPFGIWALIVLNSSDVHAAFSRRPASTAR